MPHGAMSAIRTVAGIAVAIVLIVSGVAASGLTSELSNQSTDAFFPGARVDERVVVLAIDEEFNRTAELDPLAAYGPLVAAVADANAAALVLQTEMLDTVAAQFATGDPTSFAQSQLVIALELLDNVVLPVGPRRFLDQRAASGLPVLDGPIAGNVAADAAAASGIDTVFTTATDSVVRRIPLIVEAPAAAYEPGARRALISSLALLAWMRAESLAPRVQLADDEIIVDGRTIAVEGAGELRVNFARDLLPGGGQIVTATDIGEGRVPPSQLRGKVIVAGTPRANPSASVATPIGRQIAPVFVQANAINTLLTRQFLHPRSLPVTLTSVAVVALVTAALALMLPIWLVLLAPIVTAAAFWIYAQNRFDDGQIVDPLYPLVAVVLAFIAGLGWKAFQELRTRRRVSQTFSRYVPASVARDLLHTRTAERAAHGERLHIAILFCDLRGFTPLSSTLDPAEVRELLDCYYEHLSRVVLDSSGTVLQFVGDEVFAVFGAPLPMDDYVAVSLAAARRMLDVAPAMNDELSSKGLPEVAYGIGLHAGEVIAADLGSSAHRQYTVLGDAVNIGARLCSHAGRGEILLSQEVFDAAGQIDDAEPLGVLDLKGAAGRIAGYRIRAARSTPETADLYGSVANSPPDPTP